MKYNFQIPLESKSIEIQSESWVQYTDYLCMIYVWSPPCNIIHDYTMDREIN